ncbi:MAG TPA: hypothetical protein DCZ23_05085 [Lachnospiraceae bacterium]|nr:hypothetical protein [Lachnospiraceae bacterium]
MKKILLAILADELYSNRFSDYISHHKNILDFMVFTSVNSLEAFTRHSKIDILLTDSSMACLIADIKGIQKVILLSDGNYTGQQEYPAIFKYQPAGQILKEIFDQIAEDDKIAGVAQAYSSKQLELIAVFSAFGGSGASTYARNLCSSMAEGSSVLYINMEIFDSFAEFEITPDNRYEYIRGMSEVIFYIKQKKNKLAFKLSSVTNHHSDGYSYILPVEDYRDLYSITTDDMEYFTDVLSKETIYEKVVFDVGYVNEASLRLFGICDVLLLPEPADIFQENKQNSFKRLLMRNGMDKTADNLKIVSMKKR